LLGSSELWKIDGSYLDLGRRSVRLRENKNGGDRIACINGECAEIVPVLKDKTKDTGLKIERPIPY